MRSRRRAAGIILLLVCIVDGLSAVDSAGPLAGTVLDVPHQIYYSFPGFSPRDGDGTDLRATLRSYYINEFRGYLFYTNEESFGSDGRLDDPDRADELSAMDYEALVVEGDVSFPAGYRHRLGLNARIYGYYGGFLDPFIEGLHGTFGLANASREYFPQGNTAVEIRNDRGVDISLDGPALLFGDLALYGVRTFSAGTRSALAAAWALEFPTGAAGTPAGNGYLDVGVQLLWERRLGKNWFLHLQQGVVIPGEVLVPGTEAEPLPISQSLLALEWVPLDDLHLLVQSRIHTSPISSKEPLNHALFSGAHQFELPITSLVFGAKRRSGSWLFSAWFEEDALTHEGPDFVLSLSAARSFPATGNQRR